MSQQHKVGSHKTSVFTDSEGFTNVVYHSTPVVKFSESKNKIILNSASLYKHNKNTHQSKVNHLLGFNRFKKNLIRFSP